MPIPWSIMLLTTFSTTLGMDALPGEPVMMTGSSPLNAIRGAVFPLARLLGPGSFIPGFPGLGKAPSANTGKAWKLLRASFRTNP